MSKLNAIRVLVLKLHFVDECRTAVGIYLLNVTLETYTNSRRLAKHNPTILVLMLRLFQGLSSYRPSFTLRDRSGRLRECRYTSKYIL